jgi:AcrR family transcriptional regulator
VISQPTGIDKQEEILAAALKLFVQFGFHGTPTIKIAQEAGVANGTLFHYFKTKDELIVALYIQIKEKLNSYLLSKQNEQDSIKIKFKNLFVASLSWSLENRQEFYFIQQFHFSPHLALISAEEIQKQTKLHAGLQEQAVKAKILKPLPIELIIALYGHNIYGIHQYLLDAHLSAEKQKKIIHDCFELVWGMLTKNKTE